MNKLEKAISQNPNAKPYYHKIILDLLVQLTTAKYRSLTAFKKSDEELTPEQKEKLRVYTDSVVCMLQAGLSFSEMKKFLKKSNARA